MPNAKEQLELLAAHQEEFELFLKELTGLSVKVSLGVHSTSNSTDDLLSLFDASLPMDEFKVESTERKTWITATDLKNSISVYMPDGFNTDDLFPEPEDDEEYRLAVENANTPRELTDYIDTQDDDNNPF